MALSHNSRHRDHGPRKRLERCQKIRKQRGLSWWIKKTGPPHRRLRAFNRGAISMKRAAHDSLPTLILDHVVGGGNGEDHQFTSAKILSRKARKSITNIAHSPFWPLSRPELASRTPCKTDRAACGTSGSFCSGRNASWHRVPNLFGEHVVAFTFRERVKEPRQENRRQGRSQQHVLLV